MNLRSSFADNLALFRHLTEVNLMIRQHTPGCYSPDSVLLTLPLLLYRIQLIRNLNCSSLDAGAMSKLEDCVLMLEEKLAEEVRKLVQGDK